MNNHIKGLFCVLLSSFCYALAGLISKILINIGLDPLFTVTLRNGICCFLIGVGILFLQPKSFRLKKAHIKTFLIVGFFMFVYSAGYFFALVSLNLSVAVILLYTYPAMVVIASAVIYKEKVQKPVVIALLLTFCGLLLTVNIFSGGLAQLSPIGILLALLAAVGVAAFAILVKKLTSYGYSGSVINFYSFLTSLLGYGVLLAFAQAPTLPNPSQLGQIFLCALPYTFALLFYTKGLKYLPAGKVGIIASTEPAFGILLSLLFLGEYISLPQWVGAIAILTAIFIIEAAAAKEDKSQCPSGQ